MKQLNESDFAPDPLVEFTKWYELAAQSGIVEPSAMVLSTCDRSGTVSARGVLLKQYSQEGFVFVTNYQSRKAQALYENPNASLCFLWTSLNRQIRIEGLVSRWDSVLSDQYFKTRPRASQIGAHASAQSSTLRDRAELDDRVKFFEAKFAGKEIPRPENWGGLVLKPNRIEFWQGREDRLSDRLVYIETSQADWKLERLAP